MPTESDHPSPRNDLRQRNLDRNRADVAAVALALFVERGFEATTVDDIAAAAGISRRTFFRYFESKEDAAIPYEGERLDHLRDALARRPSDEPVLLSIRHATLEVSTTDGILDRDESLARMAIVRDHPSVHARSLELQSRWEDAIAEVVAEHLGERGDPGLVARVVAGAVTAAYRAAAEAWLDAGGDADLEDLLLQALDVLTAGLALPAASTGPC